MRGLDYRWLEALDQVISQRSFERAADVLCISQSAVSQRIRQLEKWLAQPVLVRETPPRATTAGQKLLGLYRQVCVLEQDVLPQLSVREEQKVVSLTVATNADSLATWLLPALNSLITQGNLEIKLLVENEHRTLEKLKNGEVVGAISQSDKTIVGCEASLLGSMNYLCVCSPDFYQRYFAHGISLTALERAPSVAFDQHDFINEHFVAQELGYQMKSEIKHTVASSEACVKATLGGFGFALIPEIQIRKQLMQGKLINLFPTQKLHQKLYWHHWQLESGIMKKVTQAILSHAKNVLG